MADLNFTTIEEPARAALGLSRDEYAACNYIQTWSTHPENKTPGWCNRTKKQMSDFIGITDRGLNKMLQRLESDGLIERISERTFQHRITKKWFDAVTLAKGERRGEQSSFSDFEGVNKVPVMGEQSSCNEVNKVHPHKEYLHKESNNESLQAGKPPKPKKTKSEKKENTPPVIHRMVEIFEQEHQTHFKDSAGSWVGFTWQQKEFGALNSLKSEFAKRLQRRGAEFSDDAIVQGWQTFLQMAAKSDPFIVQKWFTPTKLWSNFQGIINSITKSNGKATSTNQQPTKAERQRAAFERIVRDAAENGLRGRTNFGATFGDTVPNQGI